MKEILKKVSEEDIFAHVFGFKPKILQKICSPFRHDVNPSCYFDYAPNGRLRFVDFASNGRVKNGIRLNNIDCFDAVALKRNIFNFGLNKNYILKNVKSKYFKDKKEVERRKEKKSISFLSKNFNKKDIDYWKQYGISIQDLLEDKKKAVDRFIINPYKKTIIPLKSSFADIFDERVKIYTPNSKTRKFISTCNKNDIGFLPKVDSKTLYISKSYKDARVLHNTFGVEVIYFQNEGMLPDLKILLPILYRYDKVIIFFDNDKTGIMASKKIKKILKKYLLNVERYNLPLRLLKKNITDPSDLYKFDKNLYFNILKL